MTTPVEESMTSKIAAVDGLDAKTNVPTRFPKSRGQVPGLS